MTSQSLNLSQEPTSEVPGKVKAKIITVKKTSYSLEAVPFCTALTITTLPHSPLNISLFSCNHHSKPAGGEVQREVSLTTTAAIKYRRQALPSSFGISAVVSRD
jgi:hypothetical protein